MKLLKSLLLAVSVPALLGATPTPVPTGDDATGAPGISAEVAEPGFTYAGASRPKSDLPPPPAEVAAVPVSLLVDLGSGQVLESRHPDVPFLPASVTKVMTAYVAFDEISKGRLSLDRTFQVPDWVAREWFAKGTTMYLEAGDVVSTDELLHGIMTASANDASIMLAQAYAGNVATWTAMMNAAARRLGMSRSHYNTPNGWMDGGQTHVTAADLVRLADAMITQHPQLYHEFSGRKRYVWRDIHMRSHDPTVDVIPGADGIKTGYTGEAGYNFLGSAVRDGRRLVMVLAGTPTHQERDAAARKLLEWGFAEWQTRPLFANGAIVAAARVQNGTLRKVTMVANRDIHATMPSGENLPVELFVHYRGPLVAPIAKGEEIGELEIRVGKLPAGRVPLFAGADIGVARPLDRLRNGLAALL